MSEAENDSLLAQVLSAYLSNNLVAPADLPFVIKTIKAAFSASLVGKPVLNEFNPVVPVKDSITPDVLRCLCCGKAFKALNRHLRTEHGLTPDEYRAGFNLERDYPLVAANYARQRSELAKASHLGRRPRKQEISGEVIETDL